jgi:hypothetical protein
LAGNAAYGVFSVVYRNISDLNGFLIACGLWTITGVFLFVPEWRKWLNRGA